MAIPSTPPSPPQPAGATILVVDDDRKLVDLVRLYLVRAGYRVLVAYDGEAALHLAGAHEPDLVVLDLMLPKMDGLDVCHEIRQRADIPVIMLTARSTEEDKLAGLDGGADDYVTKPFSPRELVARVRAVLRRRHEDSPSGALRVGDVVLDLRLREVRLRGALVPLTPREFGLLRVLARDPGRVFSRTELLERAVGFDYDGLERTVDVHLMNLRRKIEADPKQPRLVVTVPGFGYKLVEETERAAAAEGTRDRNG